VIITYDHWSIIILEFLLSYVLTFVLGAAGATATFFHDIVMNPADGMFHFCFLIILKFFYFQWLWTKVDQYWKQFFAMMFNCLS